MSDTKEDQGAEDTQAEMDTMLEFISSEDDDVPLESFDTQNPVGIHKTFTTRTHATNNFPPMSHIFSLSLKHLFPLAYFTLRNFKHSFPLAYFTLRNFSAVIIMSSHCIQCQPCK